ncbi:hypothetical protein F511_08296 [Dorcoceras hygrometricum]|uniref:Uncharacterized protein n=1 Tax=Dorcoceras hygrometricum TaxID=472368 RepID=A0A2Z7AKC0_9LAMI|nr:hypothetical protein F511_08296 [Dorcoceras hygrometricum]
MFNCGTLLASRRLAPTSFIGKSTLQLLAVEFYESGPRLESRLLRQSALEDLANLSRTESPPRSGRNKSDGKTGGGAWRDDGRCLGRAAERGGRSEGRRLAGISSISLITLESRHSVVCCMCLTICRLDIVVEVRGQFEQSAGQNEDRRSAPSRSRSRHEEEEEVGDLPPPVERMDVVIARDPISGTITLDSSREALPFYTILGGCCWLDRDREVAVFGRWNSDLSGPLIVVIVLGIKHVAYTHFIQLLQPLFVVVSLFSYQDARASGVSALSFPYAPSGNPGFTAGRGFNPAGGAPGGG